jgi:hypothetical protein
MRARRASNGPNELGRRTTMTMHKLMASTLSMALVVPAARAAAEGHDGKIGGKNSRPPLTLAVAGSVAGGGTFAGTLSIQKFVARDGQVMAIAMISGRLTSAAGLPLGTAAAGPIAFPVGVTPGGPITTATLPDRAVVAQATCSVLHLELNPINLNLLGLQVATLPIVLDVSGDTAGVLGHLVCTILDTLNNVIGLVDLLNQLLGLLTGLLGAIIPG